MVEKEQINAEIEKTRNSLQTKIRNLKNQKDSIDEMHSRTYKEMKESVAELEAKIVEIKAPFKKQMETLDNESSKLDSKIWNLGHRIDNLRGEVELKLTGNPIYSEEAFDYFMFKEYGFSLSNKCKIIKKPLPNGIVLIRDQRWNTVSHYAMKDGKLVGFHSTDKSEHAGDESYYYAWFGSKTLQDSDKLLTDEKTFWGNHRQSMKFRQWKKYIGEQTTFVEIQKGNEDTRKVLGRSG